MAERMEKKIGFQYMHFLRLLLDFSIAISLRLRKTKNFGLSCQNNGSNIPKRWPHLRRFTYNQIREMSKGKSKEHGATATHAFLGMLILFYLVSIVCDKGFIKAPVLILPVGWKTAILILVIGGGYFYYFKTVKDAQEAERIRQRTKALGKAALGGDWELVDHNGKTRSNKDWHGKWVLLYFGFTHCPDICPEELEKLVEVVDGIDAEKSVPNIYPLFVTVDPYRDTPEAMKEYCAEYSPKILGLTGSDEQLRGVTRAYRVYFSSGPKDDDNDYIVDHTIITYLINPRGEFVDYYGQSKTPLQMKSSIINHIYRFEAGTD